MVIKMRRQLAEIEKTITIKQINKLKEDRDFYQWKFNEATIFVTEGLAKSFKRQMQEWMIKKREYANQVKDLNMDIQLLEVHLRDGVEVKKEDIGIAGQIEGLNVKLDDTVSIIKMPTDIVNHLKKLGAIKPFKTKEV